MFFIVLFFFFAGMKYFPKENTSNELKTIVKLPNVRKMVKEKFFKNETER